MYVSVYVQYVPILLQDCRTAVGIQYVRRLIVKWERRSFNVSIAGRKSVGTQCRRHKVYVLILQKQRRHTVCYVLILPGTKTTTLPVN